MFFTPVWVYQYPDFVNDHEFLVRYLSQDDLYLVDRERNGLQTTKSNLHKDPKIQRLTDFVIESAKSSMEDMGYLPSCGITSMWATRQRKGGFHHMHSHANSFLGGTFYLFDSGDASGTTFANMDFNKYVIQPAEDSTKEKMLKSVYDIPFRMGSLILFPAWATHLTNPTESDYRLVVAMNIMPIGKTNTDHYDRYNYSNPFEMDLKEYLGVV